MYDRSEGGKEFLIGGGRGGVYNRKEGGKGCMIGEGGSV